jgi:cell division protein FtsI/penicillin-binding protein 2
MSNYIRIYTELKPNMFQRRPTLHNKRFKADWRAYQNSLIHTGNTKRLVLKRIKYAIILPVLGILLYFGISGLVDMADGRYRPEDQQANASRQSSATLEDGNLMSKAEIRTFIDSDRMLNLKDKPLYFDHAGEQFNAMTSIDFNLQAYMLSQMKWRTPRYTPRYLGIVVMDPTTGRVLSMTSFDQDNKTGNPCIMGKFPAASIFKIVTAAAAVETCDLKPNSKVAFNGGKYTLYKSQIKEKTNKYTNRILFKDSFAQSVNPVFGKLGALRLGKDTLEKYALAFGFNRDIGFEIPVAPSQVHLSEKPYQWAEIACGFNRDTTLSPLHGAMLASVVANHGILIEPSIFDRIADDKGNTIYVNHPVIIHQAIDPQTSETIMEMMQTTIKSGTCRKAFRGRKKDSVLKRLTIGGKTGSIYNRQRDARFDWFVGFATDKQSTARIAIAVVVGHGDYIGTRASQYARLAMKEYFGSYFSKANKTVEAKAQPVKTKG